MQDENYQYPRKQGMEVKRRREVTFALAHSGRENSKGKNKSSISVVSELRGGEPRIHTNVRREKRKKKHLLN